MATRELLIVILNHNNEELVADPEWPALNHSEWTKTPELQPPQTILTGESGMLRCNSSHIGGGVDGSITYRIVGIDARNEVTFMWSVSRMSGQTNSTPPVLRLTLRLRSWVGGVKRKLLSLCLVSLMLVEVVRKANGLVGPAKMADVSPGNGVWAVVTRNPVECAKSLVSGFGRN